MVAHLKTIAAEAWRLAAPEPGDLVLVLPECLSLPVKAELSPVDEVREKGSDDAAGEQIAEKLCPPRCRDRG